jgi:hypothetical protein
MDNKNEDEHNPADELNKALDEFNETPLNLTNEDKQE